MNNLLSHKFLPDYDEFNPRSNFLETFTYVEIMINVFTNTYHRNSFFFIIVVVLKWDKIDSF